MDTQERGERIKSGIAWAVAHGRKPGRSFRVPDADVIMAMGRQDLSTKQQAELIGLCRRQYILRRKKFERGIPSPVAPVTAAEAAQYGFSRRHFIVKRRLAEASGIQQEYKRPKDARSQEEIAAIIARYEAGETMAEIAADLRVSRQRVHQILKRAGAKTSVTAVGPDDR